MNLKESKGDTWGCLEGRKGKEKEWNYNIKKKSEKCFFSLGYSFNLLFWQLFLSQFVFSSIKLMIKLYSFLTISRTKITF